MNGPDINRAEVLFQKMKKENEASGYFFNPDDAFTKDLLFGLLRNGERYGYMSCPCRLATGKRSDDLDIICPCDYRDPDINEFGACYCGLYVSKKIFKVEQELKSIPERRNRMKDKEMKDEAEKPDNKKLSYPVWRCKVCGYLCARNEAPDVCPICKVTKDRFERFI